MSRERPLTQAEKEALIEKCKWKPFVENKHPAKLVGLDCGRRMYRSETLEKIVEDLALYVAGEGLCIGDNCPDVMMKVDRRWLGSQLISKIEHYLMYWPNLEEWP